MSNKRVGWWGLKQKGVLVYNLLLVGAIFGLSCGYSTSLCAQPPHWGPIRHQGRRECNLDFMPCPCPLSERGYRLETSIFAALDMHAAATSGDRWGLFLFFSVSSFVGTNVLLLGGELPLHLLHLL
jgi:hypothetical protein